MDEEHDEGNVWAVPFSDDDLMPPRTPAQMLADYEAMMAAPALRVENERLRAALTPFVEMYGYDDEQGGCLLGCGAAAAWIRNRDDRQFGDEPHAATCPYEIARAALAAGAADGEG